MDNQKTHSREGIKDGQTYLFTFDTLTGDLISETPLGAKKRDTSNYFNKKEFATMHKRLCKMLKHKKDYNALTFRLLFELIERVDFNNRIQTFTQAELADILETHQPKIHSALKSLKTDNIIEEIGHDFYFSPKFVRYMNDGGFGKQKGVRNYEKQNDEKQQEAGDADEKKQRNNK